MTSTKYIIAGGSLACIAAIWYCISKQRQTDSETPSVEQSASGTPYYLDYNMPKMYGVGSGFGNPGGAGSGDIIFGDINIGDSNSSRCKKRQGMIPSIVGSSVAAQSGVIAQAVNNTTLEIPKLPEYVQNYVEQKEAAPLDYMVAVDWEKFNCDSGAVSAALTELAAQNGYSFRQFMDKIGFPITKNVLVDDGKKDVKCTLTYSASRGWFQSCPPAIPKYKQVTTGVSPYSVGKACDFARYGTNAPYGYPFTQDQLRAAIIKALSK